MRMTSEYTWCREDTQRLKLPREINDAKDLGRLLSKYKDSHYYTVLSSFFLTYILYPWVVKHLCFLNISWNSLQTFAIPGSIFLSILSGFLFPTMFALFLVCTVSVIAYWFVWLTFQMQCSGLGATFCYFLSSLIGQGLVRKYIPERAEKWREQVCWLIPHALRIGWGFFDLNHTRIQGLRMTISLPFNSASKYLGHCIQLV